LIEADARDAAARARRAGRVAVWIGLWALALLALAHGIDSVPLMDPDEGRNAEVAREMAERGDFVVPHLNGLPYLDKPVLFFAAAALAIDALGATELAVRLPSLLAACATVALLVAFGWYAFERRTATLAGLALATAPLLLGFARIAIFDTVLTLWVSASCAAFFVAWRRGGAVWWIAGWGAAGLAVLTKGPVGVALPLSVNLAYAWACGERARRLFHPLGLAAFALVVAPWFFAVSARHPEFAHYAFVRETLERSVTSRMRRTGPVYYFLPLLLGGMLPWVLLPLAGTARLAQAWRERWAGGRTHVYLLLWIGVPLLLFSLSQSKRPGYILPVFPALALLCARALHAWPEVRRRAAWAHAGLAALAALVALAGIEPVAARIRVPEIADAVRDCAPGVGATLLVCALLSALALRLRSRLALIAGFALVPALTLLLGHGVTQAVGAHRSARALAEAVRGAGPAQVRVVGVEAYPASLPFYLGSEIPIASAGGSELKSNYIREYAADLRDAPGSTLRDLRRRERLGRRPVLARRGAAHGRAAAPPRPRRPRLPRVGAGNPRLAAAGHRRPRGRSEPAVCQPRRARLAGLQRRDLQRPRAAAALRTRGLSLRLAAQRRGSDPAALPRAR
jgi:4-amino-4-deoxy-L-arabinose transferase-like glycosyltransferase